MSGFRQKLPSPSRERQPSPTWDRRQRDVSTEQGTEILEHATQHLISDQMRPDRIYHPGARDAVDLLWHGIGSVRTGHLAQQQKARLAALCVPNHVLARSKPSEALSD